MICFSQYLLEIVLCSMCNIWFCSLDNNNAMQSDFVDCQLLACKECTKRSVQHCAKEN